MEGLRPATHSHSLYVCHWWHLNRICFKKNHEPVKCSTGLAMDNNIYTAADDYLATDGFAG